MAGIWRDTSPGYRSSGDNSMKVCIDYRLCMGHAVCESVAPQVFWLGDDAFSHLLIEDPGTDLRSTIEDAADQCPTGAISIED